MPSVNVQRRIEQMEEERLVLRGQVQTLEILSRRREEIYKLKTLTLREALEAMLAVFQEQFDGMDHENNDCAQDDTCSCPKVQRVNSAWMLGIKAMED